MTRPREPQSRIISKDSAGKVTVRTADVEGAAALTDPRLQQQLDALRGQRLSQCGRSRNSPGLRSRNSPGPGL